MADTPDNTDPDALLDALESIKHLLGEEKPPPAPRGRGAVPAPSTDEDLLPILDEVVRPGELTTSERAVLAKALLGLQGVLNQRIDRTLRQASQQIADKLKQDIQHQIDALLGP